MSFASAARGRKSVQDGYNLRTGLFKLQNCVFAREIPNSFFVCHDLTILLFLSRVETLTKNRPILNRDRDFGRENLSNYITRPWSPIVTIQKTEFKFHIEQDSKLGLSRTSSNAQSELCDFGTFLENFPNFPNVKR